MTELSPESGAALNEIAPRLAAVRMRIKQVCERADRAPSEVTLIGVSKTHRAEAIAAAVRAGLLDIGENRLQEAAPKIDAVHEGALRPRWHFIGHLQRNKARAALDLFDIIHTVDSERLAQMIDEHAATPVQVLLEVNVAGEPSKFGVSPTDVPALVERIRRLTNIDLIGLMTVAPQVRDPEDARPVFRALRELRDGTGLRELSMGMTDDFEVAIEEGSTFVRVGRAIFGARPTGAQPEGE